MSRTIRWSGHTWQVRPASECSAPGPNAWSDSASAEIDIEFARWAAPSEPDLVEFSVQPAGAGQNRRSPLTGAPPYSCRFTWAPGRVDFGVRDRGGRATAFTSTTDVFAPSASAWPFVNLWLNRGSAPTGPQVVELSRFAFSALEGA